MSYKDFPNAPNVGKGFDKVKRDKPPKPKPTTPTRYKDLPEIDHHNLEKWELTPGGAVEQSVHTQLSDRARAEHRRFMERQHMHDDPEMNHREYVNQVQDRLDKQIKETEKLREARLAREERAAKAAERQEQKKADQKQRSGSEEKSKADRDKQAPKYHMPPDKGVGHDKSDGPSRGKPGFPNRPGRGPRGGRDRGSHEHDR